MAKRLKLRISKAVSSSFHSCRSKDPSALPQDPTTYDDTKQQPRRKTPYSSFSDDSDNDDVLAKKNKCEIITFSDENANWDRDNINTNEDEKDETESIIISPCKKSVEYFSDDSSSDFSQESETIYDTTTTRRQKKIATTKRRVKNTRDKNKNGRRSSSISTTTTTTTTMTTTSSDDELPPRLSVFKKIIPCNVDGKVKDSFAIVKKSEDPYEDFKKSMMEMILEKQMYEKNDLEKLLQCFLSLNAKSYHGVIVEAFSDIWKTLFSPNHS
ncbi:hypothetical protein HAX54_044680 [Datura stramonium]|uniref:Transcription repressor n=1 Tax=Datura stramonium TaxID=4076 RepID=A0ABS8WGV8_DATST|nr:hypothetical protein [Datura stramonium]